MFVLMLVCSKDLENGVSKMHPNHTRLLKIMKTYVKNKFLKIC